MTAPARPARFTSRLTAVATLSGVAIGLGNVWRFPYMMGKYGGSAFFIVYIAFVFGLAVPALAAEWGLARATGKGTFGAFRDRFPPRLGSGLALVLLIALMIANAYYTVVIANVAYTAYYAIAHGFSGAHLGKFQAGLAHPGYQFTLATVLIICGLFVLARGLTRGIEAISRIFVPFFALTMLLLAGLALRQPGADAQLAAFIRPDFSLLGPDELFAALGQACYSVGLGGTLMIAYGRYLNRDAQLLPTAASTASFDTIAALLASIIIVPTVLLHGLDLTQGPGLIFDTLPRLVAQAPAARLFGALFLSVLTLMAFLSSLAALVFIRGGLTEAIATYRPDASPKGDTRILVVTGLLQAALMLPCCLDPSIIGILDIYVGSGMQIFGCALALIAFVHLLPKPRVLEILDLGPKLGASLRFWLQWPVLAALLLILVTYIQSQLSP